MAENAIQAAILTVFDGEVKDLLPPKRHECHVIVIVPGMEDDRPDYPKYPDYPIHPVVLCEYTAGDPKKFAHPYCDIARCKGLQLWHGRNDDRTCNQPHLLFPGDTPFWGGVKRRGIVVACSGLQPWIDKFISGMVADLLVAMAHGAWEDCPEEARGDSFLE